MSGKKHHPPAAPAPTKGHDHEAGAQLFLALLTGGASLMAIPFEPHGITGGEHSAPQSKFGNVQPKAEAGTAPVAATTATATVAPPVPRPKPGS